MMARAISSEQVAADHDPQLLCPFFSRTPPEIRNRIFKLVLTEYDDQARPYARDSFHYRPGYRFERRIDTDLLRTCRRVYLETHLLPSSLNTEHVFWCYRTSSGKVHPTDPCHYFSKMTAQQLDAVDCVHVFAHNEWMEKQWRNVCGVPEFHPRKVRITFRHSDWWRCQYMEDLAIDPRLPIGGDMDDWDSMLGWEEFFGDVSGLEELEMEFESSGSTKDQLHALARKALRWRFGVQGDRVLSTLDTDIVAYCWKSPAFRDDDMMAHVISRGARSAHSGAAPRQPDEEEVITIVEHRLPASDYQNKGAASTRRAFRDVPFLSKRDHQNELTTSYYVLRLTWRARRYDELDSDLEDL